MRRGAAHATATAAGALARFGTGLALHGGMNKPTAKPAPTTAHILDTLALRNARGGGDVTQDTYCVLQLGRSRLNASYVPLVSYSGGPINPDDD